MTGLFYCVLWTDGPKWNEDVSVRVVRNNNHNKYAQHIHMRTQKASQIFLIQSKGCTSHDFASYVPNKSPECVRNGHVNGAFHQTFQSRCEATESALSLIVTGGLAPTGKHSEGRRHKDHGDRDVFWNLCRHRYGSECSHRMSKKDQACGLRHVLSKLLSQQTQTNLSGRLNSKQISSGRTLRESKATRIVCQGQCRVQAFA